MKKLIAAAAMVAFVLLSGCAKHPVAVVDPSVAAGIFAPDETLQVGVFHRAIPDGEFVRVQYHSGWTNPNGDINLEAIDYNDRKEVKVLATKVAEKRSLKEPRWDSKTNKLLVPRLSK